ncbi:MAG: phospholipase D-like domain-containing protein [Bryobacteraceae bacterium]|nr:phospholipase D-like domain-containing protein [Bryobacteraceae bacterium]
MFTSLLLVLSGALLVLLGRLAIALAQPAPAYRTRCQPIPLDSPEYRRHIEVLTDTHFVNDSHLEVLTNGLEIYPAIFDALEQARYSIDLEAFIIHPGEVAVELRDILAERARAGVQVRALFDRFGSHETHRSFFNPVREAGGHVEWFRPVRWHTLPRLNSRNHRNVVIIDDCVAFVTGSGYSDDWFKSRPRRPRWRDTGFRVEGDIVLQLQATFIQDWLEASGEVLTDGKYEAARREPGVPAAAINEDFSPGGSSRVRILKQTFLTCARQSILIATPYFLPDDSARDDILRAVERGVRVRVVTNGNKVDHAFVRNYARMRYGPMLKAGVEIHEYLPAMYHTKSMVVDGIWSIVGTSNWDSRSFQLNNEINLAVLDEGFARRVAADFERDAAECCLLTYENWLKRSLVERVQARLGSLLWRHA